MLVIGGWASRKTIFNIGLFEKYTGQEFDTEPQRVFEEMADLW